MNRVIKIISDILFFSGLLVAGLLLFGQFTGKKPFQVFIVSSGSMEPKIKTGSVVVVSPKTSYKIGDIVTFLSGSDKKATTTHRIVGIDGKVFRSAGDANNQPDMALIPVNKIVGEVRFSVPLLGYLAAFAKTPRGFIILVIVPATIIIYEELKSLIQELSKLAKKFRLSPSLKLREGWGELHKNKDVNKAFVILPVLFAGFIFLSFSGSFFKDTEKSNSNSFTAWVPTAAPTPGDPPSGESSTPSPTPTPGPTNHIVISEVQITEGPRKTTHDFIELYNPTNNDIDLNGYRLVKRSGNSSNDSPIKAWNSSAIIPAHKFYLWASSDDPSFPPSINADTDTGYNLGSENSIALRQGPENTGTVIDSLSWNNGSSFGEGTPFSPSPDAFQSLERKAYSTSTAATMIIGGVDEFKGNGFDSENNSLDFILRTISQPQYSTGSAETP